MQIASKAFIYIYISLFPSFFFCELLWKILSALHIITLHLRHRLKLWRLVNLIHLIWESSGRVAVQTIKKHNHISLSPLPKNKLASPPFVVSAGLPPIAPFAKIKRSSLQQAKLFQMWWLTLAVRVDVDTGEKMKNGDRFPLKLGVTPPLSAEIAERFSRGTVRALITSKMTVSRLGTSGSVKSFS